MSQVLKVYVFRGSWPVPSESPFCLKLETWLRMAGIAYESIAVGGPPKSKTGKVPCIEREDGSLLADSTAIIEVLTQERGITLDADRTPRQRAEMLLVQRTLEAHTYFVGLMQRWCDHWPQTRDAYFGEILGDEDYFFGSPGVTDAIAYGFLENFPACPLPGPMQDAVTSDARLMAFLDRTRARYWEA